MPACTAWNYRKDSTPTGFKYPSSLSQGTGRGKGRPSHEKRRYRFYQKALPGHGAAGRNPQGLDVDAASRHLAADRAEVAARLATLTRREREVLDALAAGDSSKEIARVLALSRKTVDSHRNRIMAKLGMNSVVDIVRASQLLRPEPASAKPTPCLARPEPRPADRR